MIKNIFFLVFFCLLIVSCSSKNEYVNISGQAQGTTFSITYEAIDNSDYSGEVDSLFRLIDKSMSLWDSTSLISKINSGQTLGPIDEHFKVVLVSSNAIKAKTNGYFDVTVGPLVKAWGFVTKKNQVAPSQIQIDSLRSLISEISIDSNENIVKSNSKSQIDFNAIAQGYTVDVMADFLQSKGINNFLIEIGGEVYGNGKNKEGKPWKVGIEKPEETKAGLASVINLSGKALATSGSYRKYFIKDGKRYSHAVDPHTGYPVQHNLLSISVISNTCIEADAYATALLVMGLDKAKEFSKKHDIAFYAIFDQNGENQYYATEGFKKLMVE